MTFFLHLHQEEEECHSDALAMSSWQGRYQNDILPPHPPGQEEGDDTYTYIPVFQDSEAGGGGGRMSL